MDYKDILGANIATARKGIGLTQRELAERSGVSQPWIAQIELGHFTPGVARLLKVAEALGTTVSELEKYPAKYEVTTSVEPVNSVVECKNDEIKVNDEEINWWEIIRDGEVLPMVDGTFGLRLKNSSLAKLVKMEHKYRELLDEPDNDFTENEYQYLMNGQFKRFRRDINA